MSNDEGYLACADSACDALDGVGEYGIAEGDAAGLLALHGLAMYARDITRSAAALMRDGQTLGASALTRVVIEHGVLAQWLKVDPERRADLFLQQSAVEHSRWWEVVRGASPHLTQEHGDAQAGPERGPKPKNVAKEFHTVKNLFGDTETGRQLYLTYRNMSRFVHPSVTTFGRYTSSAQVGGGRRLVNRLHRDQDPEAASYFLACAIVLCTLPYLDMLDDLRAATALRLAARAAGVVTGLD